MAANPVVPAPVTPAATPSPITTVHDPVDSIRNKLAAKMQAGPNPTPGQPVPQIPVPATTPVAAPTTVETPVVAPEFNLEELDFDAPVPDEPITPVEAAPATEKIPDGTLVQQLADAIERGEVPEQLESLFLKHSRGKQMLTAFKRDRELAKAPAEGGIGRIPTVEEIKAADESHRIHTIMRDEIKSSPESFLNNLIRVDPNTGTNYFGDFNQVKEVIKNMPKVLGEVLQDASRSGDPNIRAAYAELYGLYSAPVFDNFLNHQYNVTLQMPQSNQQEITDKARFLDALQLVEYRLFGKARPLNIGPGGTTQNNGQVDPEKQQLLQRLQQTENMMRQNQQQFAQNVNNTVESQFKSGAMSDIDKMLSISGVDKHYDAALLDPFKSSVYSEVSGLMQSHDPGGYQRLQHEIQQASKGQIDPSVPATTRRNLFRAALRSNAAVREKISNLVTRAKGQNESQADRLARSQNQVEPRGSGMQARTGTGAIPAKLERNQGESSEEFLSRRIRTASEGLVRKPQ